MLQMRQVASVEEDRRERRDFAARTELPSAFVAVSEYLRRNLDGWRDLVAGTTATVPDYPFAAVATIRDCIEAARTEHRENLAHIPRRLQVIHTRLASAIQGAGPTLLMRTDGFTGECMLEVVTVLERVNRAFPYARGGNTLPGRPDMGLVSTRAFVEDIHESDFPAFFEALRHEYGVEPTPDAGPMS